MFNDGLILVSLEYNDGVPGVFKNAVDWLSRPTTGFTNVFKDRPVAVIGASPGVFGIILAQNHWLPVLRALGVRYWSGGRLMVSRASTVFADDGTLKDSAIRGQIEEFIGGFSAYVEAASVRQKLEN